MAPKSYEVFYNYVVNIIIFILLNISLPDRKFLEWREFLVGTPVCWWRHYNVLMTSSGAPFFKKTWPVTVPQSVVAGSPCSYPFFSHSLIYHIIKTPFFVRLQGCNVFSRCNDQSDCDPYPCELDCLPFFSFKFKLCIKKVDWLPSFATAPWTTSCTVTFDKQWLLIWLPTLNQ